MQRAMSSSSFSRAAQRLIRVRNRIPGRKHHHLHQGDYVRPTVHRSHSLHSTASVVSSSLYHRSARDKCSGKEESQSRKSWKFSRRRISSRQKLLFSSSTSQSSRSLFPSATTIEDLWKHSTARFLDQDQTPIGSLDSLQWHLAETLVLYWSQTKQNYGTRTRNNRSGDTASHSSQTGQFLRGDGSRHRQNGNAGEENETDCSAALETMTRGHQLALRILERLAEEKMAVVTAQAPPANKRAAAENQHADDKDDFRTIDVSLIHAFLKHWKDCLQTSNETKSNRRNAHPCARDRNRSQRDHKPQGDSTVDSNPVAAPTKYASTSDSPPDANPRHETNAEQQRGQRILLPSQLLQILDGWVSEASVSPTTSVSPLFEPNIATYTLLMDGAVSCRSYHESAGFCEALLERLVRESEGSDHNHHHNHHQHLRPTMVTLGTFFQALANHKTIASAELAESWLRRIPSVVAPHGTVTARPNAVVYTTVIRAWASLGRADRAEALLREMCHGYVSRSGEEEEDDEAARPNLWTFNTVLAAWSRSKDPGAVQKAESLLRTMESLSSSSSSSTPTIPNRRGNETANDELEDGLDPSGNNHSTGKPSFALQLDVAPTIVSYNSLLSTIASRSRRPDSLARAEIWMEEILHKATIAAVGAAASAATTAVATNREGPRGAGANMRRGRRGGGNRYQGKKKHDLSLDPNLITYRALFNIIAGAGHLSDSEKADRMRYWLARGTASTSASASASTRGGNSCYDGNDGGTNRPLLQNHPILLEQIRAFETKNPNP